MWAEKFGLCRTDPRYLDATDDDVMADLVVSMYREGERRRLDPKTAVNEEAAANPELMEAVDAGVRSALSAGRLGRQVEAMLGKASAKKPLPLSESVAKRLRTSSRPRRAATDVDKGGSRE